MFAAIPQQSWNNVKKQHILRKSEYQISHFERYVWLGWMICQSVLSGSYEYYRSYWLQKFVGDINSDFLRFSKWSLWNHICCFLPNKFVVKLSNTGN